MKVQEVYRSSHAYPQAIVALAGSLYDLTFEPETSTGNLIRRATVDHGAGGEGGSVEWRPCPDCSHGDRPGVVVDRFKRALPCVTCGGRLEERDPETGKLRVRSRKGSGRVLVDRYTERAVSSSVQDAAPAVVERQCDRCLGHGVIPTGKRRGKRCPQCDGSGVRERLVGRRAILADDPPPDAGGDPVDRAIDRRDELGSWHALELCLAELARRSPHRRAVFDRVHVVTAGRAQARELVELELRAHERRWLREAVGDLCKLMPDPVRVPDDVLRPGRPKGLRGPARHAHGIAGRDAELLRRYQAGEPVSALAVTFGLSERAVRLALDRADAA